MNPFGHRDDYGSTTGSGGTRGRRHGAPVVGTIPPDESLTVPFSGKVHDPRMRPRAAILIAVVTSLLAANVVVTTQAPKAIRDGVATLRQRAAERREAAKPRVLDSDEVQTIFGRNFFGVDEWKTVCGIEVRDAPEPLVTERLCTATCPIEGEGRRISGTHRLILIPGELDLATLEAIFRDRVRLSSEVTIKCLDGRQAIRNLVDKSSKDLGTRWILVPKPELWLASDHYRHFRDYDSDVTREVSRRVKYYEPALVIETLVSILCAYHFQDRVPDFRMKCLEYKVGHLSIQYRDARNDGGARTGIFQDEEAYEMLKEVAARNGLVHREVAICEKGGLLGREPGAWSIKRDVSSREPEK